MLIKLNVGGTIFTTTKSIICQSKYFQTLLNKFSINKLEDDSLFIDDDPNLFIHILNKLRHPGYIYPENLAENLAILSEYYQIVNININNQNNNNIQIMENIFKINSGEIIKLNNTNNNNINYNKISFLVKGRCDFELDNSIIFYLNNNKVLQITTNKINCVFDIIINDDTDIKKTYVLKQKYLDVINRYDFNSIQVDFKFDTTNYDEQMYSYYSTLLIISMENFT